MEEKHKFTTFDSVTVLSLLSGVLILVGGIITNAMVDQKLEHAKSRSKQLAMQILVGGLSWSRTEFGKYDNEKDRNPAGISEEFISPEGRIGMDPWGAPYYYKTSTTDKGLVVVTVFSSGPDKILQVDTGETLLSNLALSSGSSDDIVSTEKRQMR